MTPIERAAQALHRARMARQHPKPDNYPWEGLSQRDQALLRMDVRAVLTAIREPSEAMIIAGVRSGGWSDWYDDDGEFRAPADDVFRVMVDALLAEPRQE